MTRKKLMGAPVKLSDVQVKEIIGLLMGNRTISDISQLYNVNTQMIINLIKGRGRFKLLLLLPEHEALVKKFKEESNLNLEKRGQKKKFNFSEEIVLQMLEDLKSSNFREIANKYNCSYSTVYLILTTHPKYKKKKVDHVKLNKEEVIMVQPKKIIDINELINNCIRIGLSEVLVSPELFALSITKASNGFKRIDSLDIESCKLVAVFRVMDIINKMMIIEQYETEMLFLRVKNAILKNSKD